ncbi:MAG TPA: prolyl aminopeptidase [Fimbriimonadaceae bacterium]|nr:prolyl aminopeptidase [Fimbriimonadaceae bacterium]
MCPVPFPEIEPNRSGWLDVGDGHEIYWEECGNPAGKPVVVLHGGPGSGCSPGNRRYYDPALWRIILFDQRNCGRSRPHASLPTVDLSANTTWHLVSDMEALRGFLEVEQWLLQGGSWGASLALAYAERHPQRVSGMILLSATSGRRSETDLLTHGLGRILPAAWERLSSFASRAGEGLHVIEAYARLLFDPSPKVREEAARRWCEWETAILPTAPAPSPRYESPEFRLAFARLVTHYWSHGSWLEEGQLLRDAGKLAGIPGVILQGRLDLGNLSGTAWELAAAWPGSELVFVEECGHEGGKSFSDALLEWTHRLGP